MDNQEDKVIIPQNNYEYVINGYDINIVVNENNTLNITEKINTYFNIEKHGIFRKIPLRNHVTRLDGTKSNNRAKINDIKVSDKYSVYNENGYKVIKIGDENNTIKGQRNYTLSYSYNLGKDTGKNYDELYFNLIGNEWDTTIDNITFTITMPKDFDKSKLVFSIGFKGSTDSSNITFNVDGNTITGKLNKKLNPAEAMTIRLELPEGYFVVKESYLDMIINSFIKIAPYCSIIFVLITYIFWNRHGKENQVVETVEFYPPQGLNSLEVGYLYHGKAYNQEVVSLLIYLANEGYIKISEYEEKILFKTTQEFKITKLKEYNGNNVNEAMFLDGIFSLGNNNMEVTSRDLYNKFYYTKNKILKNMNTKENKYKIFEKKSLDAIKYIIAMFAIIYILISYQPIVENVQSDELPIVTFLMMSFVFWVGFIVIMLCLTTNKTKKKHLPDPAGIILSTPWLGIWIYVLTPAIKLYPIAYTISLLSMVILLVFIYIMSKRTNYGNQMLGKIKGFKNFLETAEKEQLEAMVMNNPSYFYHLLPYTYVLGVSDKWIEKFETISLESPSWYDGQSNFSAATFNSFIKNTITTAESSLISSPGGGSSGGGSSGGGSGGGGGGSW